MLTEVSTGVWAAVSRQHGWCHSNAALLSDGGQGLLFDATMTIASGTALWQAVREHAAGDVHLVYSHCNIDHVWGSAAMPEVAEVLASDATARELEEETPTPRLRALQASAAGYVQEHFGSFDLTGLPDIARAPDRTFDSRLELRVGARDVELLRLGPAHTRGDCVVHIPDAGVVFAGDLLFFGDHPICWGQGSLTGWSRALRRLLESGAHTFVPGHGPVAGREEVAGLLSYMEDIAQYATLAAQRGVPAAETVAEYTPASSWRQPERLASMVQAAYQEAGCGEELAQLSMIGLIAEAHRIRHRVGASGS